MAEQDDFKPKPFPSKDLDERLKYYGLDPFIKTLPALPPTRADLRFDPKDEQTKRYYVRAEVKSFDDLKMWLGWPNDHIDHRRHWQHLKCVAVPFIDPRKQDDALRDVEANVIADAEYNLLHAYVDDVLLKHPFWKAVHRRLLDRYRFIDILAILELEVADRQTVTIANTPTAYFNQIRVHGSGRIVFENSGKVIADTIERIP